MSELERYDYMLLLKELVLPAGVSASSAPASIALTWKRGKQSRGTIKKTALHQDDLKYEWDEADGSIQVEATTVRGLSTEEQKKKLLHIAFKEGDNSRKIGQTIINLSQYRTEDFQIIELPIDLRLVNGDSVKATLSFDLLTTKLSEEIIEDSDADEEDKMLLDDGQDAGLKNIGRSSVDGNMEDDTKQATDDETVSDVEIDDIDVSDEEDDEAPVKPTTPTSAHSSQPKTESSAQLLEVEEKLKFYAEENRRLTEKISQLQEEQIQFELTMNELEDMNNALKRELSARNDELSEYKSGTIDPELAATIQQLKEENSLLKLQLEAVSADLNDGEIRVSREKYEGLERQINDLTDLVTDAEIEKERLESEAHELRTQKESLENQVSRLLEKLSFLERRSAASIDGSSAPISGDNALQLEMDNENLRQQLASEQAKSESMSKELAEVKWKLASINAQQNRKAKNDQDDFAIFKSKMDVVRAELKAERNKVTDLEIKIEELTEAMQVAEKAFQHDITQLREKMREAEEAANAQLKLRDEERRELEAKYRELKQNQVDVSDLNDTLKRLMDEKSEIIQDNERLEAENKRMREMTSKDIARMQHGGESMHDSSSDLDLKDLTTEEYQRRLVQMKQQLQFESEARNKLATIKATLEQKLEELTKKYNNLNMRQGASTDERVKTLEEKNQLLEAQIVNLERELGRLQESSRNEKADATETIRKLKAQVDEFEVNTRKLEIDNSRLQKQVQKQSVLFSQQSESEDEKIKRMKQHMDELENRNRQLEDEMHQNQAKLELDIKEKNSLIRKLEEKVEDFKNKLLQAEQMQQTLIQRLEDVQAHSRKQLKEKEQQLNDIKKSIATKEGDTKELQAALAKENAARLNTEVEFNKLKEQVRLERETMDQMKSRFENNEKKLREYAKEKAELEARVQEAESQLRENRSASKFGKEARSKLDMLTRKAEQLTNENYELTMQIASLKKQLDDAKRVSEESLKEKYKFEEKMKDMQYQLDRQAQQIKKQLLLEQEKREEEEHALQEALYGDTHTRSRRSQRHVNSRLKLAGYGSPSTLSVSADRTSPLNSPRTASRDSVSSADGKDDSAARIKELENKLSEDKRKYEKMIEEEKRRQEEIRREYEDKLDRARHEARSEERKKNTEIQLLKDELEELKTEMERKETRSRRKTGQYSANVLATATASASASAADDTKVRELEKTIAEQKKKYEKQLEDERKRYEDMKRDLEIEKAKADTERNRVKQAEKTKQAEIDALNEEIVKIKREKSDLERNLRMAQRKLERNAL
eukprot:GEZU01015259.1.p1 GENE.GEZU01015259.1~~GEZU01015259.1.p1  ORF type:complete len:1289 (-),score=542.74 GEZU01015259.1:137-4003(-)